jgi:hypothetical protein
VSESLALTFEASLFSRRAMAKREGLKLKRLASQPRTKARPARRSRQRARKGLTEAQKAQPVAAKEFKQERQARVQTEQDRTGTKRHSSKARKAARIKAETDESSLIILGEAGGEKRVSFVLRVTVDARGQPWRTEIEHAHSGKKEIFPALDVQRLTAFVKACIGSPAQLEPVTTLLSPARRGTTSREFTKRAVSLTNLDVKIFSAHSPGIMTLTLDPDEDFVVQARFQLQGPDAFSLTADEFSYEMKVYANEVTSGTSKLLTTHSANLVKDVLEYTPQADVSGLSPGLYRLVTLVTLHTPIKMAARHTRLIIHVAGIQASTNPAPGGVSKVSSTRVGR